MRLLKAFGAGFGALRDSVPRLISIARELSLEIVGFLFFVFAALFVFSPFGFIQACRNLPEGLGRALLSGGGALMWAWFGFTSFRRAKKLSRER